MSSAQMAVGLPMAWSMGLLYGLGPCLVSCMPFLAPVFLGRDFGMRQSWQVVVPLSLGRLVAYSLLGAAAGAAGSAFGEAVATPLIRFLVGCATVMMGLALLWRQRPCPSPASNPTGTPLQRLDWRSTPRPLLPGGLFLMGVSMALTPCAPLGLVLLSAALSASPLTGFGLALAFGLGAIVVPALVFGIGAAYLGQQLRRQLAGWRPWLERLAASLLLLVGLTNLFR